MKDGGSVFPFQVKRGAWKDAVAVQTPHGERLIFEKSCYDDDATPSAGQVAYLLNAVYANAMLAAHKKEQS